MTRKRIFGLLVLLAIPVTAAAQNQPGRFLISPRPDIIFECNVDGSNCFHRTGASSTALDPGGGDQDPSIAFLPSIAGNGTMAFQAAYTPDGTCAGYDNQGICTSHVFIMDSDGTNVRQITFNPPSPATNFYAGDRDVAISPDGSMVAFVATRTVLYDANLIPSGHAAVYVVNIDGSGLRQVTPFTFDSNGTPHGDMLSVAWNPDSTTLAFKGTGYGSDCGTFQGRLIDFLAVGTVGVDGAGFHYIACDENPDGGAVMAVDWSPDGTRIAYARDTGTGEPAIRFTSPNGQVLGSLTTAQLGIPYSGGKFCVGIRHCLHFSPDSTKLAYENNFPSDNPAFAGISTINLDGSGRVDAIQFGASYDSAGVTHGMWWAPGPALSPATQLTLSPDPVEVWPGFSHQLTPSLLDGQNNTISRTASAFTVGYVYHHACYVEVGPYGLVMFRSIGEFSQEGSAITAFNESLTSNSVTFKCWASAPCIYTLSASSADFSSAGGSGSVFVTSDPGANASSCPWTATSNDGWITITSGSQGSGSAWVSYTVAPDSGSARSGTMTIGGQTFTVNQSTTPPPSADVSITKTDSPDPVTVGSNITYTVTVTNNGPSGATSVAVSDALATSVTFVSATPSQGSCSGTTIISCSLGALANGLSATVTIVVMTTQTGSVGNTAAVTHGESDPNSSNDSATATTMVNPVAPSLTALNPAKLWIGQNDSLRQLKFDVLVEVLVNGSVVGSGQLANLSAGGSDFAHATLDTVALALGAATPLPSGATLSIRPSVRASCSMKSNGSVSGAARLWYNGQPLDTGKPATRDAGSRFDATIGGATSTYFLRSAFALATVAGASKEFVDVRVDNSVACPARPYTPVGTWTITMP